MCATDLGVRHGKGFNRSNLIYMRMFYLRFPISATASHLLSWSHYVELLKLDDDLERGFYEKQVIAERYATPLPKLTDEVATLAARVDEHLKKMGALWN